MTTALAIYAAVVATLGLGWQTVSWWLARRTRIDVLVFGEFLLKVGAPVIFVKAVNRSSHPMNIQGVGLQMPDGRIYMPPHPDDATIPGVVAPRDSGLTYFPAPALKGLIDPYGPITAEVATAIRTFKSKPTVAIPR